MIRKTCIASVLACLAFGSPAFAADEAKPGGQKKAAAEAESAEAKPRGKRGAAAQHPPTLDGAHVEVYKTVGDTKLNAYVYRPADWKPTDKRPAIVFFFGGGWTSGSPKQFENHCKHLASRGMVAITADYRVKSRQGVTPVECVADGKSAVRWIRANADKLGVDPDRIAAAGGSAGGHVAACTGVLEQFDEAGEDAKVSSRPNALVLFNPAVDVAILRSRLGDKAADLSPLQHIKAGVPPTIIFHGKADKTVPYASAEAFEAAMKKAGNRCELVGYEGQPHGFFNHRGPDGGEMYKDTIRRTDAFLTAIGYLAAPSGQPTGK